MVDDINCSEYDRLWELFADGYFVAGWDCTMTGGDPMQQVLMGGIIFGAVGLSLFISTGSLLIPSVLAILFAGVIFALLPPTMVNIALVAMLLILSAAGIMLTRRIDRR